MKLSREKYGYPISKKLSQSLRELTNVKDRQEVAKETNVSYSSIRDLLCSQNTLTVNNEPAIVLLIEVAIDKAKRLKEDSNKLKRMLKN